MADCFVIMPITTPKESITSFNGDKDHFQHVLEHLFIPAIRTINFTPIQPMMTGADVIQAEIIKQLESADLVLCDISSLNPNVFFELGIRTAVDKPVAIVKDSLTAKIPFDTTIINHHTYDHNLAPWIIQNEIQSLSNHLLQTINRSENRNTLWKYFGLSTRALLSSKEPSIEQKLDYILLQLEGISRNTIENTITTKPNMVVDRDFALDLITDAAQKIASQWGAKFTLAERTDNSITLDLGPFRLPTDAIELIEKLGSNNDIAVKVTTKRQMP